MQDQGYVEQDGEEDELDRLAQPLPPLALPLFCGPTSNPCPLFGEVGRAGCGRLTGLGVVSSSSWERLGQRDHHWINRDGHWARQTSQQVCVVRVLCRVSV